jgi:FMN reductase
MMNGIKVVGVGGSMAETSSSLSALEIALAGAEEAGAEVQLFSIREMNLPIFVPTSRDVPEMARRFVMASHEAHGLIWCSPTYHAAMSGAFKNALDWLELLRNDAPPYLTDKIIGLISTAGGTMGLQAINCMEFVVRALRGWAVPLVIPIPQVWQSVNEEGQLRDPSIERQLRGLGAEVVRAARQFADDGFSEYAEAGELLRE